MSNKVKNSFRVMAIVMVIVWMGIIFSFSNQPGKESADISGTVAYRLVDGADDIFSLSLDDSKKGNIAEAINFPIRKCAHMTEYGILCLLIYIVFFSFEKSEVFCKRGALIWVIVYAASDEFHQLFVPGRSAKVVDVLVDTVGACIMLLVIKVFLKIKNKGKR